MPEDPQPGVVVTETQTPDRDGILNHHTGSALLSGSDYMQVLLTV